MSDLVIPSVDAQDAKPGTFGAVSSVNFLPNLKNYANVDTVVDYVKLWILPVITQCRFDRAELEEEWHAIRRMEMLKHDDGQKYKGRSNAYLPVYARNLNTQVSMLSKGLFPSDDYMDVSDRNGINPDAPKKVKQYIQWEFETNARVRAKFKPWLRQFLKYGNSPMKYWYQQESYFEGRLKKPDALLAQLAAPPAPEAEFKQLCLDGLRVSARNLFYWYVYPMTAESLDDATLVFEDIDVPKQHIEKMAAKGDWLNTEGLQQLNPEHQASMSRHFDDAAGAPTPQMFNDNPIGAVYTVTEAWTFMPLPDDAAYLPGEKKGQPVPVRIVLCGDQVLRIQRNPLFTQKPPYLVGRMNVLPGFFYGHGIGRMCRDTQYLANDFANQTNDCGMYGLNPIALINPNLMLRPPAPMAPGVAYYTSDVAAAMKFDRPPIEQIQHGLLLMNTIIGLNQDLGGSPPALQGIGKGAKTATNAQILQKNASVPLQDIVEDIELDVMIPLMHGAWVLAQQYRTDPVMARVAGEVIRIAPTDLAIDADFRWMASSQAMNSQQRAQAAIQFLQTLPPLLPLLQQMGKTIDPTPVLNRVYSDGMGFRGFADVIKDMPQQPQVPGQPGQPGLPPGVGPGQPPGGPGLPPGADPGPMMAAGDRVRSAVEQAGGEPGNMVPGEGEDFMDVRNNADALAGEMGNI